MCWSISKFLYAKLEVGGQRLIPDSNREPFLNLYSFDCEWFMTRGCISTIVHVVGNYLVGLNSSRPLSGLVGATTPATDLALRH